MISFNSGLVLLIVLVVSGYSVELNSEFDLRSGQHATNNTPLCRTVRNIKKNLLQEFQSRFKGDELACDIQDNCKSTNFTYTSTSRRPITGGYELSLCHGTPFVRFWIGVENRTESYNFTVKHETQRIEIMRNNSNNDDYTSSQKWYLRVTLDMNKSRARDQLSSDSHNYLSLTTNFEVWDRLTKQPEKPFLDINVMNDTRFYLNQVCSDTSEGPQNLQSRETSRIQHSPIKSLHDNNLLANDNFKLDDLHINVKRTSPMSSSQIGKKCSGKDAFACGIDATCHVSGDAGVCECLEGFILANNGSCTAVVNPTVQPTPSQLNGTYSSALGALLSVIVLIAVAAAIFFGAKYRVFSRVRSRFSLHMPFRRGTTIDDQVGMIDPFAEDDDDPPLL